MRDLALFFSTCLVPVFLYGQQIPDLQKLDSTLKKWTSDWKVPGMEVGIVKDGKLVFNGNYGRKDLGKEGAPDANTLYAIASNSKAFTSTIIGMLVDEGKLDWDDKVVDYLPYFELYDPWVSQHTTITDLLSHRVGLGTFSGDIIWYKSDFTSEEIVRRVKYLEPEFGFRDGYGYSNLMFITAGEVIRKVTGKSWAENVQERILNPLDMNRTITSITQLESMGNFALPYGWQEQQNKELAWVNWDAAAATGGLISSVNDLSKWVDFNINNGIINGDTLLSPASRNRLWNMENPYKVDRNSPNYFDRHFNGYAMGWRTNDVYGEFMVSHGGAYDGFLTYISIIPEERLGIIVLTNGLHSPYVSTTYHILDQYFGVDSIDWSEKILGLYGDGGEDPRITEIKKSRVEKTKPSVSQDKYCGTYYSDILGEIYISKEKDQLQLNFQHTRGLAADLYHWHYDVWEIRWKEPQGWFDFGTLRFKMNDRLEITGLEFNVPNDDIFFEELKPYRIKP